MQKPKEKINDAAQQGKEKSASTASTGTGSIKHIAGKVLALLALSAVIPSNELVRKDHVIDEIEHIDPSTQVGKLKTLHHPIQKEEAEYKKNLSDGLNENKHITLRSFISNLILILHFQKLIVI